MATLRSAQIALTDNFIYPRNVMKIEKEFAVKEKLEIVRNGRAKGSWSAEIFGRCPQKQFGFLKALRFLVLFNTV